MVYLHCLKKYGEPPPILGVTLKEKEVLKKRHSKGITFRGIDVSLYC